jgi:hypothetical protein
VAIAESLLHDEIPVEGAFRFSFDALKQRYAHRFSGSTLRVLDLTGATLKRLSGHADLCLITTPTVRDVVERTVKR